jgi:hypothetical protein
MGISYDTMTSLYTAIMPYFKYIQYAVPPAVFASGYVPKIGPGRALTLALKSMLRSPTSKTSLRHDQVASLRMQLKGKWEQEYIVGKV